MALFAGYRGAHGTHGAMQKNSEKNGKLEIKKTARTLREPVTEELWDKHLDGEYYLGVIPLTEEGMSHFGCIDVDRYDVNLGEIAATLKKRKLPMLVCRSKSGGAHVYMFLREPAPAADLRSRLRQIAASMGWGECEIFPKQNQIMSERGDLGNWLNMPYQNAKEPERYAVRETMAAMSLKEFLTEAERLRTTLEATEQGATAGPQDESLDDGPPCLQHMCSVGFPEGQKNNGFFGLATFCKKKYGVRWKEVLEEYNRKFFNPPRPADEVISTIKRVEEKDYNYRCKDQPLVSYCNSVLCRSRRYGVGGGGHYPSISGLSKLDTEPAIWFLDINDSRVELSSRQLSNYQEFQIVCMERINVTFMPMKRETWLEMVGNAMDQTLVIEAPPELGTHGHFQELLHDFLHDRHRGETKEDLLLGRPWFSEEEGRHYFRLRDLTAFLKREGFVEWGRNQVGQRVQELGEKHFFNIKDKGLNVLWVAADFKPDPTVALPPSRRDPI